MYDAIMSSLGQMDKTPDKVSKSETSILPFKKTNSLFDVNDFIQMVDTASATRKKQTLFSSSNSFLGKEENLSFSETVDSWKQNDLLVFQSRAFNKKTNLQNILIENRQNSSKHIAEQIFNTFESKKVFRMPKHTI